MRAATRSDRSNGGCWYCTQKEELEGEDLRIVRIERVGSKAWEVYKEWACSLGEADPMVQAVVAPTVDVETSASSPPAALGLQLQRDANSIINHMAPLLLADFPLEGFQRFLVLSQLHS